MPGSSHATSMVCRRRKIGRCCVGLGTRSACNARGDRVALLLSVLSALNLHLIRSAEFFSSLARVRMLFWVLVG